MAAYHQAIARNRACFNGKVVLDVGTGTGLLAVWAAQAGARAVYAVEATEMAQHARVLADANGVGDVVQIFESKVEDVELPEKVDLVISEWMGLLLLREGMLDAVLLGRDRWLKPGGTMWPSHADIVLGVSCCDEAAQSRESARKDNQGLDVLGEWGRLVSHLKETYDIDYSCLTDAITAEQKSYHLQGTIEDILNDDEAVEVDEDEDDSFVVIDEARAAGALRLNSRWTTLRPVRLLSSSSIVATIDLATVQLEQLEALRCPFTLSCTAPESINSLTVWFDVHFRGGVQEEITLSTGPGLESQDTHWGQQSMFLHCKEGSSPASAARSEAGEGLFEGDLEIFRVEGCKRMYDAKLHSWKLQLKDGERCGGPAYYAVA